VNRDSVRSGAVVLSAVLACLFTFVFGFAYGIPLAVWWVAATVYFVLVYRVPRWWLALTLPALIWIYFVAGIYYACHFRHDCL